MLFAPDYATGEFMADQRSSEESMVILLAFANDRVTGAASYLRNLVEERRQIEAAIAPAMAELPLRLVIETNTTHERLFDLLDKLQEEIVGVHFGGHADPEGLYFEDERGRPVPARIEGIASRLAGLSHLRWVFLNGCATSTHVSLLHRAIPVPIIATSSAIRDHAAMRFAYRFYHAFARGLTLADAFDAARSEAMSLHESAADVRRTRHPGEPVERILRPAESRLDEMHEWPWMLLSPKGRAAAATWRLAERRSPGSAMGYALPDAVSGRESGPVLRLLLAHVEADDSTSPYPPLLGAYVDERQFGGRDVETADLRLQIEHAPIVCVFAVSGAGKSSLLQAGLLPRLLGEGTPTALVRAPHQPGAPSELLRLLSDPALPAPHPAAFADALETIHRLARRPPVLILDQFEELFKGPEGAVARARLGPFLAATNRAGPDGRAPLCRCVLAYRREFHADVEAWLADVLKEAREHGVSLDDWPYDLTAGGRQIAWSLPLFGEPPRGRASAGAARDAFLDAITRPLRRTDAGQRWRMRETDAIRLAEAFARARQEQPDRPLVPELQVVLARLVNTAVDGEIGVPEDIETDIEHALQKHVETSIARVVPPARHPVAAERSLVLAALYRLVDTDGRRSRSLARADLESVLTISGDVSRAARIIDRLTGEGVRLLISESDPDRGQMLALSHDQLARVVAELVAQRPGQVFDPALLELAEFVHRRQALFRQHDPAALAPSDAHYDRLLENDALLWDDVRRGWWRDWQAATNRHRHLEAERLAEARRQASAAQRARRTAKMGLVVALVGVIAAVFGWQRSVIDAQGEQLAAQRRAYVMALSSAYDEIVLSALAQLVESGMDPDQAVEHLPGSMKADLWSLMSTTFVDLPPSLDAGLRLALVREGLTRIMEPMPYPVDAYSAVERFGQVLLALEVASRHGGNAVDVERLREQTRAQLFMRFPLPEAIDEATLIGTWVELPGGYFTMGELEGEPEAGEMKSWLPLAAHPVRLSPYLMAEAEVTAGQFRRLVPSHDPTDADDMPARNISWFAARTYAEWVGARLPTNAEWEFGARWQGPHATGRRGRYCSGDTVSDLKRVAWFAENSGGHPHPVKQKAPCGGLYDMHGNVYEWTAEWAIPTRPEKGDVPTDPLGPPTGDAKYLRGGAYDSFAWMLRSAYPRTVAPDFRVERFGFRLARSMEPPRRPRP